MNMFVYSGRFTRDPELKDSNGNKYVFFSLAQDVPVKDGERRPIFPTFTAFGKTAEAICKYFKKGSGIEVTGHLDTRTTEGDGKDTKITRESHIVDRWGFCPVSNGGAKGESDTHVKKTESAPADNATSGSDDLPF